MPKSNLPRVLAGLLLAAAAAKAASPVLIALDSLNLPNGDLSGLTGTLENGVPATSFGGIGSGLAYAGGNTFLAVPDRGPNATPFAGGDTIDNTASFIGRWHDLEVNLNPGSGVLPYSLSITLKKSTLMASATPLIYGNVLPNPAPALNPPGLYYFNGRSDNFGSGLSTNSDFARLDPEGVRLSRDRKSVFVTDEYGPYVYQFDRATGKRTHSFALPDHFAITHLNSKGSLEISGNTSGRVTNKGMEGLAISPDGKTLVGFVQSPLLQDGGDGGRFCRIITIDIASGATHEYAYDDTIPAQKKNFNSSEILALNDHQFLVLERDGKGLGDGSSAVVKTLYAVDIKGATDVSNISGAANLKPVALSKTLFLDIVGALTAKGISVKSIPSKLEGIAFGADIVRNGVVNHTLYMGNDNDFVPDVSGQNKIFVFAFADADLPAGFSYQPQVFNVAPVADAGSNLQITTSQVSATTVNGTVSDEDGDALSCRWSEGGTVLRDWFPANAGSCPLPLAGLGLSIETHDLTLKVTDQKDASANDVLLTIGNSAPTVDAAGVGTYEINVSISVSGTAADFDGDHLHFEWTVDGQALCSGDIVAPAGGTPIALGSCPANGLSLGSHTALLSVTDGVNAPASASVVLEIVDTSVPTLAPVVTPAILWPPNHNMVDVAIDSHAADNSGIVTVSASVSSNEPQNGLGDGDTDVDWTTPVVDPATGRVSLQLRAERSGKGNGRIYTVTVKAVDDVGNTSQANVTVKVPFNASKK
ncbi:MAG: esterase-like activity of phytase family protein [Fibrobacteres bacterium]|jgi:hypothetical protein|nr:esterase-like activity of phytase family protein [Fibrobacterota bacterium]